MYRIGIGTGMLFYFQSVSEWLKFSKLVSIGMNQLKVSQSFNTKVFNVLKVLAIDVESKSLLFS